MTTPVEPSKSRPVLFLVLGVAAVLGVIALVVWLIGNPLVGRRPDPTAPTPPHVPPLFWEGQPVGTTAKFRGLSVVSGEVVWASGTGGTVVRSIDGGKTWAVNVVPGAAELDFRDVEAFGPGVAYALAAGEGEKSRIYKTTDGGATWAVQFTNPDPAGFFDAIAFWDETHGLALGDPVGGTFQLVHTIDGKTWQPLTGEMPAALAGEGAFAASGTCLITHGDNGAWFVTGGPNGGRVFHSTDRGKTWTLQTSPLTAGSKSAGVFGIAFRDELNGVIVGGDYTKPDELGPNAAVTSDGGKTWKLTDPLAFRSVRGVGERAVGGGRHVGVGCERRQGVADARRRQVEQRGVQGGGRLGRRPRRPGGQVAVVTLASRAA